MNFNNIAAKYEELVLIEEQQAKVCEDMIGHCIQDAVTSGQVALPVGERTLFIGELALDGSIRPVNGVLSMVDLAKWEGFHSVLLPEENAGEARLIKILMIYIITFVKLFHNKSN